MKKQKQEVLEDDGNTPTYSLPITASSSATAALPPPETTGLVVLLLARLTGGALCFSFFVFK